MIRMMLRITILHLLLITTLATTDRDARLRGSRDERMREHDEAQRKLPADDNMATNSNPGLSALKHFGIDPKAFTVAGADSVTFVPCYDNKVCTPLSVIENLTDADVTLQNIKCTSVEDCEQGECRHVLYEGLLCDYGNQALCQYECVYDDTAGDGDLPD